MHKFSIKCVLPMHKLHEFFRPTLGTGPTAVVGCPRCLQHQPAAIITDAVLRACRCQWQWHTTRLPTVPMASRRQPVFANDWQVPWPQLLQAVAITRPMVTVVASERTARTWLLHWQRLVRGLARVDSVRLWRPASAC